MSLILLKMYEISCDTSIPRKETAHAAYQMAVIAINTQNGQNRPDDFGNILPTKAYLRKRFMKKSSSEATKQLSFKYFAKFPLILKLFSKV